MVMRTRLEEHNDDGMSEILSLALKKEAQKGGSQMDSLLAAADELGISHESVVEAEQEYRLEAQRKQELNVYRNEMRKGFRGHLVSYISVNVFLMALNVGTFFDDHQVWAFYPLLGWGIGLSIHWMSTRRPLDWNDTEFQKWRHRRDCIETDIKLK